MRQYHEGPPSDHFDGTRFFNPDHPRIDRSLGDLLRWRFRGERAKWTREPGGQAVPAARATAPTVTMIGHASILIQVAGLNLLVDPVWSRRVGPLGWLGPARVNPPGVAFDDLPPIDAVLLTHNHYDHLDASALARLWRRHRPRVVAPLGNDRVVARAAPGVEVETLDWHEATSLRDDVTVSLHPAHHWSARGLRDRRMALWGGFVVKTPAGTIYIAGDTGYGDGEIFRDVAVRHGAPDLAILPIGAYAPRWFMQAQHVDPGEAVRIMLDCGARRAVGVHWGTFQLTDEPRLEPRARLQEELERQGLPPDMFVALEPGDVWSAGRAG